MDRKQIHFGGQYKVLTDRNIEEIHEASVQLLTNTGFEVSFPEAQAILENGGARVDKSKSRAYLTREIISKCVKQAPAEFTFYGREEGKDIVLGGRRVHFGTGGKALYILDTNKDRRPAELKDIVNLGRLTDKLEYADFYIIPVQPHNVNINYLDVIEFYHAFKSTTKPVMGGVTDLEGLKKVIEMASIMAGSIEKLQDKPFVGFITSITSPLKLEDDRVEILIEIARNKLPLVTSTAPIAGATAPVTLSGTLVLQNAEALIGVVLSQLVNPGTPVLYSAVPCMMDMRSGSFLMGTIESGLMNAAIAQMSQYYRVPCYTTVGAADSKLPDAQSAYESATTCMLTALSGGNFVHQAFGFLEGALTISYGKYIIDNDIIGSCMRTLRGIVVNEETMALDVIAKVGPGGNFLAEEHTVKFMRSERFSPATTNTFSYDKWQKEGKQSTWERSEDIAAKILKEEPKVLLPVEIDSIIDSKFPEIKALEISA